MRLPKIFCKNLFYCSLHRQSKRQKRTSGMLIFALIPSTQIINNEVCVLPDTCLHRLPIDRKLRVVRS